MSKLLCPKCLKFCPNLQQSKAFGSTLAHPAPPAPTPLIGQIPQNFKTHRNRQWNSEICNCFQVLCFSHKTCGGKHKICGVKVVLNLQHFMMHFGMRSWDIKC